MNIFKVGALFGRMTCYRGVNGVVSTLRFDVDGTVFDLDCNRFGHKQLQKFDC